METKNKVPLHPYMVWLSNEGTYCVDAQSPWFARRKANILLNKERYAPGEAPTITRIERMDNPIVTTTPALSSMPASTQNAVLELATAAGEQLKNSNPILTGTMVEVAPPRTRRTKVIVQSKAANPCGGDTKLGCGHELGGITRLLQINSKGQYSPRGKTTHGVMFCLGCAKKILGE